MIDKVREQVRELAVRAGLAGVPEPILYAVLLLVLVTCAVVGVRTWQSYAPPPADTAVEAPGDGAQDDRATPKSAAPAAETSAVVVYVTGRVRKPGVYRLAPGSRLGDAVAAAGGTIAGADTAGVNLARVAKDGEQVSITATGDKAAAGAAGAAASGADGPPGMAPAADSVVDLNAADAAALDALPGVGPATAKRIVEDREKNGPFKSVEDLMRVTGIGPKKFDSLKDLVSVSP